MKAAALEAITNVLIGCAINWLILFFVFGQPIAATAVMLSMIVFTWLRSFLIRLAFSRLN